MLFVCIKQSNTQTHAHTTNTAFNPLKCKYLPHFPGVYATLYISVDGCFFLPHLVSKSIIFVCIYKNAFDSSFYALCSGFFVLLDIYIHTNILPVQSDILLWLRYRFEYQFSFHLKCSNVTAVHCWAEKSIIIIIELSNILMGTAFMSHVPFACPRWMK